MKGLWEQIDNSYIREYNSDPSAVAEMLNEWAKHEELTSAQEGLRQKLAVAKMFDVITQEEFDSLHRMSNSNNIEDVNFALIILEQKRKPHGSNI
jgi:hypothetical protein